MLEQMIKLYSWYMGADNLVFSGVCCGPAPVLVGTILYDLIRIRIFNADNCWAYRTIQGMSVILWAKRVEAIISKGYYILSFTFKCPVASWHLEPQAPSDTQQRRLLKAQCVRFSRIRRCGSTSQTISTVIPAFWRPNLIFYELWRQGKITETEADPRPGLL